MIIIRVLGESENDKIDLGV